MDFSIGGINQLFGIAPSNAPTKSLDEGVPVTVANNQASGDASWFDTLNDLGDKAGNYLNDIFGAYVDKKVSDIKGNPDRAALSTGNPGDQPQGGVEEPAKPFHVQYQRELMYGGAAVLGLVVLVAVLKR